MEDAAQQASEVAGKALDKVSEQAKVTASTQKEKITRGLDATAHAIRQTGQSLKQEQPMVADYADKAAQRVDSVSGYLRERDIDEVIGDVQDYARRNKAMFIAGTMLAGFLTARLVKTAGRRQQIAQSSPTPYSGTRPVGIATSTYVPVGNSAMEIEPDQDSYDLGLERPTIDAGNISRARTNGN